MANIDPTKLAVGVGIIIHEDMSDNDMLIHKKYIPVYGKGNLLIQKFKACSDDIKLHLFRTFCYNITFMVVIYGLFINTGYEQIISSNF